MEKEINGTIYEVSTKLGVVRAVEQKFHCPFSEVFDKLQTGEVDELIFILAAGVPADQRQDIRADIEAAWDYMELNLAAQEFCLKAMFSGTPEQIEKKLAQFPADDNGKNSIRELLGIPTVPAQTAEAPEPIPDQERPGK